MARIVLTLGAAAVAAVAMAVIVGRCPDLVGNMSAEVGLSAPRESSQVPASLGPAKSTRPISRPKAIPIPHFVPSGPLPERQPVPNTGPLDSSRARPSLVPPPGRAVQAHGPRADHGLVITRPMVPVIFPERPGQNAAGGEGAGGIRRLPPVGPTRLRAAESIRPHDDGSRSFYPTTGTD